MENLINIYDKSEWKEAKGYPKGTMIKTLRNEEGAKTVLLKLPEGFLQTRQCRIDLMSLRNMFHQRKNHFLPEWQLFFSEIKKGLPQIIWEWVVS